MQQLWKQRTNKVKFFFYGLYLELLLLIDRIPKRKRKPTPREVAQAIREYSLVDEGVKLVKRRLKPLLNSNRAENEVTLSDTGELIQFAYNDPDSSKSKAINAIRSNLDFSNKDIKNDTDHARMVERRIKDYQDLHADIAKRNALREARKQKNGR